MHEPALLSYTVYMVEGPNKPGEKTPRQQLIEDRDALLMSIVQDFQGQLAIGFKTGDFSFVKDYVRRLGTTVEEFEQKHKAHWHDKK